MNRIHRKVEYALISLRHMKSKPMGELTTVKEICRNYGCSFDATSRVLQIMVQKGLLKSEQGAQGGYRVIRDLTEVSLHDLMEMLIGPIRVVKCLEEKEKNCEMLSRCNVMGPLSYLNERIVNFYQSIYLEPMLSVSDSSIYENQNAHFGGPLESKSNG